jgi:hypothetical protein
MFLKPSKKLFYSSAVLIVLAITAVVIYPSDPIDYNTEVKPILNKKCITCHGGVKQEGGFSLLFEEEAFAPTKSGKPAIIKFKPEESELIRRLHLTDPEERMPYKHDPLTKDEIKILTTWVKEGAKWGSHWAYQKVKEPAVPSINDDWVNNNIDKYIVEKLEAEKLSPSKEADKATLLRRASLDITGLPANKKIAAKYLNDNSDKAYENLVNDLMATPAYGEKWAALWLDLARYADTKGFEADRGRNIYKYRDWLISAFNTDKPYNDFLTEQIAGDLLPNPSDAQYIATAFHRNTMNNDEGGTDNEEFRTAAVLDRVNTTWSAVMGTSFNCVQCHSHPYDPFKHDEYYKFMAFFNNTRDEDSPFENPVLRQYQGADNVKFESVKKWLQQNANAPTANYWITFLRTLQPSINAFQCDKFVNGANGWYATLRNNGTCNLKNVVLTGKSELLFKYASRVDKGVWRIYLDSLTGPLVKEVPVKNTGGGFVHTTTSLPDIKGTHTLYFKYYSPTIKNSTDDGILFEWFSFGNPFPAKEKPGYDSAYKYFNDLIMAGAETTPIMMDANEDLFRPTHVFERGSWLSKGKLVAPDVPAVLPGLPKNAPKNRLGLAMWLTDKNNPLVSRTLVNRLWEQLFGTGIVETLEDIGTQGLSPTHQSLLDYLAWQLMYTHNWSIKKTLKEILLSATYRQQSMFTKELLKKDPYNKLYARGPRVRLSAEQIRDQTLAVSTLLSPKMYGKSVMPYQPDGIWRSPYNGDSWKLSEGEDQYRRSLYTYFKRTAPYPSMLTFDGGAREVCVIRRIRTNTPLQALTSLNDSSYIIMARSFAKSMDKVNGPIEAKIKMGYEEMMYKPIAPAKLNVLTSLYQSSLSKYQSNKKAATVLVSDSTLASPTNRAALVVVANAMLNLDEWLNKN